MYCQKCGKQLSDEARFCNACGMSVQTVGINGSIPLSNVQSNAAQIKPEQQPYFATQKQKKSGFMWWQIVLIVGGALFALSMIAVIGIAITRHKAANSLESILSKEKPLSEKELQGRWEVEIPVPIMNGITSGETSQVELWSGVESDAAFKTEWEFGSDGALKITLDRESYAKGIKEYYKALVSYLQKISPDEFMEQIENAGQMEEFEDSMEDAELTVSEFMEEMVEWISELLSEIDDMLDSDEYEDEGETWKYRYELNGNRIYLDDEGKYIEFIYDGTNIFLRSYSDLDKDKKPLTLEGVIMKKTAN